MRLGMRGRIGGKAVTILIAFTSVLAVVVTAKRLEPAFVTRAHSFANTMVTDVIEESVDEALSEYDCAGSQVRENGSTTTIEANVSGINRLKSKITTKIQDGIAARCSDTIYIPLGSASGLYLLSGTGPKIPVKISPSAIVNTNFDEEFNAAGINQVRHSMKVNVDVQMTYRGYILNETETINTDAVVIDEIIAGTVPQYYGNGEVGIME